MSALVPYRGAQYALRAARIYRYYRRRVGGSFKYAPYLVRTGKFLARNAGFRSKAKTAISKFVKWKRKQRTAVGESVNNNTSKNRVTHSGTNLIATYNLYSQNITEITKGDNINQRSRNAIDISGFKICAELKNHSNTPMYVNVAVVQQKNSSVAIESGFFRGHTGERGDDFYDVTHTSNWMHCTSINPDKLKILCHMRFLLAGNFDSSSGPIEELFSSARSNYKRFERWIPLKRRITYDNNSTNIPTDSNVKLVYWCNKFGHGPALTSELSMLHFGVSVKCYFRDPKQCCG